MLVPHTFDAERHLYLVPETFTMATSDVLSLNGLSLYDGVPKAVLEHASMRGREVHAAVHCYEENRPLPDISDEAWQRFMYYLRWKEATGFEVCGPCERTMVYEHEGTGQAIGAMPDLIGRFPNLDVIWVVDIKNYARQSGEAKKQKLFEVRLQTQSYKEGLLQDEELWETWGPQEMRRMVLHLHPECGIEKRGGERLGYETYLFPHDDSDLWHAAVVMAAAKLANGHKRPERE